MIKKISLFIVTAFLLTGCKGGNCDDLQEIMDRILADTREIVALDCDSYPDKWSEASANGASKEALDSIAAEHQACEQKRDKLIEDINEANTEYHDEINRLVRENAISECEDKLNEFNQKMAEISS